MLLFGGVSAIGFQPSYAADRTVATWSELVTAFQTAPSGDTIILSADITQTSGSLRLQDGASLTLDLHGYKLNITAPPSQGAPGVGVYENSSLTIEDGVGGGVLNATGSPNGKGAGIGADNNKTAGTIIINSGTIIAVGSSGGAGIGGGGLQGSNGTVIINGGTVNAIGNNGAAGIGGGAYGSGGTVIINGGNVSATGNNGGAGIGAGYSEGSYTAAGAAVTITGGTVTVSTGNTLGYSAIGGRPFGSLNNSGGTIVLPSGHRLIIPSGVTFENAGTIEGGGTLTGAGTVHNTGTISSNVSGVAVNGNAYDLTFDLNGAPGMPPSSLHVLASTMQAAGKSLAIPAPSGYEFDGWYTSTGTLFTNTTPISSITSTGSATLYAKWKDFKIVSVVPISDIHVSYDTPLGTVALPATVNVTLSNGETKTTAVTWNGGTPAYNGSQPGTYVFAGTLTVPEGSSNSDGLTASVSVIVGDPKVTSVEALSDIHVSYGTLLSAIGLPATVNVTLISGETKAASVTWNGGVPAYNGNQPGTYTFTGTLAAPAGFVNPDSITASIGVVVEDPTVTSVSTSSDIHVAYGTELEDIGLPTTVDVTLSSGNTEQATVVWNGGTPAYNGNQPGTYTFTGTLTAPAGSTNPNGLTASIHVIVEDPTVTSVSTLTDIHVAYGTELEDIGLPTTVDVTLSSGETKAASVTWNGGIPAYNGTQPGTYVFIGTLTPPVGSTNPNGLTASVTVIVEDPTVTSVSTLTDIHVAYGTELEDIGLPTTVDVTLSSGNTEQATVTWNGGTPAYNGTQPGTYKFTGTLTAPAGSTNPNGLTASVHVIVEDPTVTSVDTLSDIHVPYGTELGDVGLLPTVDVTLSSGNTEQATVTWNGGTPAYNGTQPGTYSFTGTLTAPAGSTNPNGLTASIHVIVEDPTVTSVSTLTDIHVAYGTELEDIGLPTTVDVTLSSGDTEQATVVWDGGIPAYNGNQPGTYSFTGTLTAPTGSTNPNGLTASIRVIVEDPTIITVGALLDIHVPYGTELEDAELPPTVGVTLSSGDTEQATVVWDGGTPVYNGTQPGTYTFTGTLTAPAGSTNPSGLTASINVIVEDPTVISVASLSDIRVSYGTRLDNVKLPTTVEVTLSSGDKQEASITWDEGDPAYSGTKSGKYTFTGTLTPPAGATNPDNMTASVNVIVDSDRSSGSAPASIPLATSTRIYCETGGCTISLGDQVEVSVPPKAVNLPFYLTLERLEKDEVQLPDGAQWLSQVFRLTRNVEDQPLQLPMTLLIRLESTKIGEGRRAALFAYDELTGKWAEVNGSLADEVFTAQTDKFADFAVLSVVKQTPPSQPQPEEPGILLSDINGHWAEAEIKAAVAKGIVTGYQDGTFRPNQQVSRVEFTALLNRALKLIGSEGASENPQSEFADAASIPTWARSSVAEATAQGLIRGFADGTFRPGELISRTEMAVIAVRALHLSGSPDTKLAFVDTNEIPVWAREAVAAVQRAGLMNGKNGNRFAPRAPVTRAEAAGLIIRMMEHPR